MIAQLNTSESATPDGARAQVSARLGFLDGIRGAAAAWVLLSHALKFTGWRLPLLHRGDLAVDIFMMMSGLLMTHHYWLREGQEPWEKRSTWGAFYLRRFFRIAPLYYLALAVSLAAGPMLWTARQQIAAVFPDAATPAERYLDRSIGNILMHVSFLFGASPRNAFATPLPDWSIGLEMQFYLVFPFLMLLLRRGSLFWGTLTVAACGLVVSQVLLPGRFPMPSFLPLKISLFLVGILLAWGYHLQQRQRGGVGPVIGLALVLAATERSGPVFGMAALAAALLFYDRQADVFQIRRLLELAERLLGSRVATFAADTSYSVYLTHVLVMVPVAGLLCRSAEFIQLPGAARFLILSASVMVPVYALSWLLFRFVELPGIRAGKRLASLGARLCSGPRFARAGTMQTQGV